MTASGSQSAEICEFLCDQHVDLNQQEKGTGQTAIWMASYGGFLDVVEALIRFGANLDLTRSVC